MLPIEITVGGASPNPASGQAVYSNPALAGLEYYVTQAGFGPLPSTAYSKQSNGGFTLLDGILFEPGETYFAHLTGVTFSSTNTDYTNGYHYDKVMSVMLGRLGWSDTTLSPANQMTKSGRYFDGNSFHPLVSIKNLKATIETVNISTGELDTFLQRLQRESIMTCLSGVFNKPELIEQKLLFDRGVNNDQDISNAGNFVGVRIKLAPGKDIAAEITSLALYFNEAKTFTLYLYHDTKKQPIWTQEVTTVANDQTIITLTTAIYLNIRINSYKSGYFYFGYYQDDLGTAKAIDEQSCSVTGNCFAADFFQSKKTGDDFDRKKISLTSYTFGINFEISVFRDHTDSIIRNAHLFDDAIGNQMAYMCLKQMLYAIRSNTEERQVKEMLDKYGGSLIYEVEGAAAIPDVPKTTGLKQKIDQALKSLHKSFFPEPKAMVVNYADC